MSAVPLPSARVQFLDQNGAPLTGGSVSFYVPGTLSPKRTWADAAMTAPNPATITLDGLGSCSAFGLGLYRQIVNDQNGNLIWDDETIAADAAYMVGQVSFAAFSGSSLRSSASRALDTPCIFELSLPGLTADWGPVFARALQSGRRYLLPAMYDSNGDVLPYIMATPVNVVPLNGSGLGGQGRDTLIQPTFAGSDYFYIGSATTDTWSVNLEDFRVLPSVAQSAGYYAIHYKRAIDCYLRNVYLYSLEDWNDNAQAVMLAGGVYFEQFGSCGMFGGGVCGASGDGLTLCGDASDENYGAEFTLDQQAYFYGCNWAVHAAGSAGGLYLKRVNISNCSNGLRLSTLGTGTPNRELFTYSDFTVDTCPGYGVHIEASALAYWLGGGIWVGACGAAGQPAVMIEPTPVGETQVYVHQIVPRIHNSYYDGWSQNSGAFNCRVDAFSNGAGGAAGGHGFYFGAGCAEVVIDGLSESNGNTTRGYGLYVEAAVNVVDARVSGASNGQAAMHNVGGVSAVRRFHNTAGYTARSNGSAGVPTGQGSVVVNHGLADAPTSVLLSPAGPQDAGASWYASALTATTFTITLSQAAGAVRSFFFEAIRE